MNPLAETEATSGRTAEPAKRGSRPRRAEGAADRSPGGESGIPACYRGSELSNTPDRRILFMAIVNCQSLRLAGEVQSSVPVAAFGKFFLTLPLAGSQSEIFVEMVGLVKPGDGVNFDIIQLYR